MECSLKVRRMWQRRPIGNTIAEVGPVLFVFFLLVFFPLVNLIVLGLNYGCVKYFNFIETRELAIRQKELGISQQVHREVFASWRETGMFAFCGGNTSVWRSFPTYNADTTVTNTNVVVVPPFLTIPLFARVPGLNAPVTFVVSDRVAKEDIR
jgi:hypothetical protein